MATSVRKTLCAKIGEGKSSRLSKGIKLFLQISMGFACKYSLWTLDVHKAAHTFIHQDLKIFATILQLLITIRQCEY